MPEESWIVVGPSKLATIWEVEVLKFTEPTLLIGVRLVVEHFGAAVGAVSPYGNASRIDSLDCRVKLVIITPLARTYVK